MKVISSSGPIYSHVDDATLERLNALAIATEPAGSQGNSTRHALSLEITTLIRDQVREKRSAYKDALLVTEQRLIDCDWQMVEAVLDFGNVVERAAALVRLLGFTDGPPAERDRHATWQRQLSQLLVRYPVLMDHRLGFAGVTGDSFTVVHAPLPHLLAHASFASLPCVSHSIAEKELRRFAALSCVKAGLTRMSFVSKTAGSPQTVNSVPGIAFSHTEPQRPRPAFAPATKGQFVASLLQLSELARQGTGRGILSGDHGLAERDGLYRSLAITFWDVAANGGAYSGISRRDFVDTLSLPSPADPQLTISTYVHGGERQLPYYLGIYFDRGLKGGDCEGVPAPIPALEHKINGVRNAIGMLVEIGLQPDPRAAAQWLADQIIGHRRLSNDGSCPKWQHNEIMAVLDVLEEHGARVRLTGQDAAPLGPTADAEMYSTWLQLLDLHARKSDMAAVIAARTQEAAAAAVSAAAAPESRRRRMAL